LINLGCGGVLKPKIYLRVVFKTKPRFPNQGLQFNMRGKMNHEGLIFKKTVFT